MFQNQMILALGLLAVEAQLLHAICAHREARPVSFDRERAQPSFGRNSIIVALV